MNVSVIASGSNGNCCLLEDKDTSVLLDAGISIKEYEKRMQRLEKDPALTKAIVITHAHRDHIKGAGPISRKYNIPILITQQTYADSSTIIKKAEVRFFSTLSDFKIGNMNITPIRTSHDVFSCGFKINDFGLFTDTGIITSQIREVFPKLKSVLIEANYDHDMLKNGNYPQFLKKRIFSDV
ncbi:MAG: MBL fold metallo-hydrolase, partial [Candidatus Woesearchaeota archaeon]